VAHLREPSFEILVDIDGHGHARSNLWTMHLSYASLPSIEHVFLWDWLSGRIDASAIHAMRICRAASKTAPFCLLAENVSENLSASISDFMPHFE
jgi:hypothetical protein